MKKYKLGETFEYEGVTLEVCEEESKGKCEGCYFHNKEGVGCYLHHIKHELQFTCETCQRRDRTSIIYKQINKRERNLKLTLEQARELYKKPEMRELLLTTFTKEELEEKVLKDWEDLGWIGGYNIKAKSEISDFIWVPVSDDNKNIYTTKKHAKSALAMAQLSQLMQNLDDECNVDWSRRGVSKSCIKKVNNIIINETAGEYYHFLAFKTRKIAEAFMKKHERLIKDYYMID